MTETPGQARQELLLQQRVQTRAITGAACGASQHSLHPAVDALGSNIIGAGVHRTSQNRIVRGVLAGSADLQHAFGRRLARRRMALRLIDPCEPSERTLAIVHGLVATQNQREREGASSNHDGSIARNIDG